MFTGKKSAQIREILISESAWEEMTCLFAPSLVLNDFQPLPIYVFISEQTTRQKIPRYLSEFPEQMFLQNPYLQCV
ncbi:Uncharacterised protein [Escherichia coli]|nr:Uncharacterised protein [Escherichia coli]